MKKIRLGNDIGFTWRLFTRLMEPYNVEEVKDLAGLVDNYVKVVK